MASALPILALAVAGAAIAILVYNLLSGRNFVLDNADKLRLKSRSVDAWQGFWERNPRRSEIVICLTSIPSRLPHIETTIKSLLYQRVAPREIRLHLPLTSRREGAAYDIPGWLARLPAVTIVRCEDHGPATKLIPALYDHDPDQTLLIVDDDKLYPDTMTEHFDAAAARHPDSALGSSGWLVPPDLTDRKVTAWRNFRGLPPARLKATRLSQPIHVDVIQGHSGYLVRPRFFDRDSLVADYAQAPAAAFYVDDVWISAYCKAPKLVVPARRFCFVAYKLSALYDRTSLESVNNGGGDPERSYNTVMIRYLRDRWGRRPDQ